MNNSSVRVRIVRNNFSEKTQEEMWQVYRQYYHYTREEFMSRIKRNNYYSMYTCNGRIVGFTGLRIHRIRGIAGRQLLVYYGQTVIEAAYRGKSLIPTTGAKLCLRFAWDILTSKVYFWADCLTYKAYLVFAKSVAEYYPSYRQSTPREIQQLIDRIGMMNYQDTYCPETGTVRKDKVLVNDSTLVIRPEYTTDPDVSFYQRANPEYGQGHGLITLTPMNWKNVRLVFERYFRRVSRRTSLAPAEPAMRPSDPLLAAKTESL